MERWEAFESFKKMGFPTIRHEEWKYTNLKDITGQNLKFIVPSKGKPVSRETVEQFRVAGKNAIVVVFVNGFYDAALSDVFPENSGVTLHNLATGHASETETSTLNKIAPFATEPFVALNTAFVKDGLLVHIPSGIVMEQPVHFLHINNNEDASQVISIRNHIVAEKNSRVSIVETYHASGNNCKGLINSVTEVIVNENAVVELVKAQIESEQSSHINFTQVLQERNSTFD